MCEPEAMDLLELSRRIATLDLVITVDTAIANLAGTVGVKTWMLCSMASEWRWFSGRNDSPWYPAIKIYRQREAGRWGDVLDALKADLLEGLFPLA
jgi:ADP-heptose:LPS heptosyltransferase